MPSTCEPRIVRLARRDPCSGIRDPISRAVPCTKPCAMIDASNPGALIVAHRRSDRDLTWRSEIGRSHLDRCRMRPSDASRRTAAVTNISSSQFVSPSGTCTGSRIPDPRLRIPTLGQRVFGNGRGLVAVGHSRKPLRRPSGGINEPMGGTNGGKSRFKRFLRDFAAVWLVWRATCSERKSSF